MTKIGIGIITYNRRADAMRTYEAVTAMTAGPHTVVVADDGSQDGTAEAFRAIGVPCITGANRRIAWNKNRALYYLYEVARCDVMLLLEDDCFPTAPGWERAWINPTLAFGHVNLLSAGVGPFIVRRVPEHPGLALTSMISAQCTSFSRAGIAAVGYLDPRFAGFGYEHVEHSRRFLRVGMAGLAHQGDGIDLYYSLHSDLELMQGETFGTPALMSDNEAVYHAVQDEPVYRAAWRSREERTMLEAEIRAATALGGSLTERIRARSGLLGRIFGR